MTELAHLRDADEPFELCDEHGHPLGEVKPRALVHRDGDWHRSFHCWVVVPGATPAIVLQQRSDDKDTWPGLWDVSVGGHYRAGEGIVGGLREIAEELGLAVAEDELVHVGWRREVAFYPNGLVEREVQDIYFLVRQIGLGALAPDPGEVPAVALVPAMALRQLAHGRMTRLAAPGGQVGPDRRVTEGVVTLTPDLLVPRADNYYGKATRLAEALARGTATVRRRRWW